MNAERWVPVVVNIDDCVIIGKEEVFVGEAVEYEDHVYTLRDTKHAGRHIVVHNKSGEYVFHMMCNRPGRYFLGHTHGYRKIPANEEPCPVKRALRQRNLSIHYIEEIDPGISHTAKEHKNRLPLAGNKYDFFITDGKREPLEALGRTVFQVFTFSYIVHVGIDYKNVQSPFYWINKITLVKDISFDSLQECANVLVDLLDKNQVTSYALDVEELSYE